MPTEYPGQLNPSLSHAAWQALQKLGRGSSCEHKSSTGRPCDLLRAQEPCGLRSLSQCRHAWHPCSVVMLGACTGKVPEADTHPGSMIVLKPRPGSVHVPETHPGSVLVLGACGGLREGLGAFKVHGVLIAHRIVQGPQLAAQGALAIG